MNDLDLFRYLVDGTSAYTLQTIAFNMSVTTVLGLFVFFVYKKTFTGVLYSLSFNVSIVAIALTTAMIIMLIGSNLAISLGMVGALSIVRFRSAIKEPRDLAFLFWAICVGLSAGTGAFLIAAVGSVFIAAVFFVFGRAVHSDCCYLLILKGNRLQQQAAEEALKRFGVTYKLRMQNRGLGYIEMTYEVYLKKQRTQVLMEYFSGNSDVGTEEVNLVSFSGEVTG
ncbi:MAG: DUF4956 domain-containing protein [Eubacteriales bacterium]|nr:DUF4956 domain-containing protein [Eubacteriales bacterium]